MLNNIEISRYINTKSFIHKLNPLNKLLTLILFLIITFINNIYIHILLFIYLLFLLKISRIGVINYFNQIKKLLIFIFLIFLLNYIMNVDIILNILNTFRIIEMIIYSSLLIMTTTNLELIYSINKFIKNNEVTLIFFFTLKFIPLIIDQINNIINSLKLKGITIKTKHKITYLKAIIIPTIINSLKVADNFGDMLIIKKYNLRIINYEWNKKDTFVLIMYILGGTYAIFTYFFL